MRTMNLGILAHVDAGKTSLTERLLFAAGAIQSIGSVDRGTTRTDTLAQERQRGITIKSAVASFVIDDITVNLIDTPGHPDFIAEVERVLNALDGVILVVSAVEGVQAQTRKLMRAIQRLRLPCLIFVNKIDRPGAQYETILQAISEKLTPAIIAMGTPCHFGTADADFVPHEPSGSEFSAGLVELMADRNDAILAAYVDGNPLPSHDDLRSELAAQTKNALVHPVFFGSAITGAGVDTLLAGLVDLLLVATGDSTAAVSGTVFKIERGHSGEKVAYVRMFSGSLHARDRLHLGGRDEKITAIRVFHQGEAAARPVVGAGQIAMLTGLESVRVGDALGTGGRARDRPQFAPPTLETVVFPRYASDRGRLHLALAQLAEQDPLINLRQDDGLQEISVSLYGEVQKEVIQETLATDFGVVVGFRETTTICIERPIGTGTALEVAPDPFVATVGLRIEPAPAGSGTVFCLGVEIGSLPVGFFKAVEEAVYTTLDQGLYGWKVTGCRITMTDATRRRHWGPATTAAQHRNLTPLVVMSALQRAETQVCEPVHRFELEIPADGLGAILQVLALLHAIPEVPKLRGASCVIEGEIPAARIHELQRQLPSLTRGEGVLETVFDRYEPVHGTPPVRRRSGQNPLNRTEYLLRLTAQG